MIFTNMFVMTLRTGGWSLASACNEADNATAVEIGGLQSEGEDNKLANDPEINSITMQLPTWCTCTTVY